MEADMPSCLPINGEPLEGQVVPSAVAIPEVHG